MIYPMALAGRGPQGAGAWVLDPVPPPLPEPEPEEPEPPVEPPAYASVVLDFATGAVVRSVNADAVHPQASTTKLMTALLAYEYCPALMDTVAISAAAEATLGSQAWLYEGEVYTLNQLLLALMLPSGNDAAHAIAEHVGQRYLGGTSAADGYARFVARMNTRAAELGMLATVYTEPHGGTADLAHVTSARDLAVLCRACMQQAVLLQIAGTLEVGALPVAGGTARKRWTNNTRFLGRYPGTVAGKRGWNPAALHGLAALHQRGSESLVAAVLHSADAEADAAAELDAAYAVLGTPLGALAGRAAAHHVTWAGQWYTSAYNPGLYRDGYGMYCTTASALNSASYTWWGTGVRIVGPVGPSFGRMDVSVDGGAVTMVEQYSAAAAKGAVLHEITGLADGPHSLLLQGRADKHASSTGLYHLALDEFETARN